MRHIDADALTQDLIRRGFYPAIVKRAIEDAPTAKGEWISVDDRLPEKDGAYIVVGRNRTPHIAHFYTGKNGFSNPYTTHWMPFPEPPKGGDEQ